MNKIRRITLLLIGLLILFSSPRLKASASVREQQIHDALMMHLAFDEGSGYVVRDQSKKLPDRELNYLYKGALFMDAQEPQWRKGGIRGGSLLLDGTSTYLQYNRRDLQVEGTQLTISLWVAPRMFEWSDPKAADRGEDRLTGLIGQSNKAARQGFLLGYERFGRLSFQVGTGEEWLSIWTNGDNLQRYTWNHVGATFDADASEMSLYLNGELVASRSLPEGAKIAPTKNMALTVGRNPEGERLSAGFLNVASGYLDEVQLWSLALSEDEILSIYNSETVPEIAFKDIWLQNILTKDKTRPQFHPSPYQFWMNEPHAPFYYNGMYHLFYQANITGSYWRNIAWGHFVSPDMVNWKPVREAIVPTEYSVVPDGVWSGAATFDNKGVPLLFFTAGNDDFLSVPGLISNQNIGYAYPKDLSDPELTDWTIGEELAISQQAGQGRRGQFRDPFIWQEDGLWCMLICSGSTNSNGGTALLYTTDTLELMEDGSLQQNWIYKGPVYEMLDQPMLYGATWELPIILPVQNQDESMTKHAFIFSPAPANIADNNIYYFVGSFDPHAGSFLPDESFGGIPRRLDYGPNVFTGPSAFIDPISKDRLLFSIMQDQRSAAVQGASGWAHNGGLARRIWLSDDGKDLMMAPVDALKSLEGKNLINQSKISLEEANQQLSSVKGDMLRISLTADVSMADSFGILLKQGGKWDQTMFTYKVKSQTIHGETANRGEGAPTSFVSGALALPDDGKIAMDILIDRSLVEAFFNQSKSISLRAYVEDDASENIQLFSEGNVHIESIVVVEMNSIFN